MKIDVFPANFPQGISVEQYVVNRLETYPAKLLELFKQFEDIKAEIIEQLRPTMEVQVPQDNGLMSRLFSLEINGITYLIDCKRAVRD